MHVRRFQRTIYNGCTSSFSQLPFQLSKLSITTLLSIQNMPLSSDMDQKNTLKDWSSHNPRPAAASEDIHFEISINVFDSPTSIGECLSNSQRHDAKSTNPGNGEQTYVIVPIDNEEAKLRKQLYCKSKRPDSMLSGCKVG